MKLFSMTLLIIGAFVLGPSVAIAGPPDIIDQVCIDPADRTTIRLERAACDDLATRGDDGFLQRRNLPALQSGGY